MRGQSTDFVFPGLKGSKLLSNMAMLNLLGCAGRGDVTAHGFRSTFRDWAAERTNFPRGVAGAALAHAVGNKVEAAYRRGDLFEKRRRLMDAWAEFCAKPAMSTGAVVTLRPATWHSRHMILGRLKCPWRARVKNTGTKLAVLL
jgi:hypothetical protein